MMHFESFLPLALLLGLFVVLAAVCLYEWVYRFADRTAHDVIPYLRPVDLEEVKSLFYTSSENYLRLNLPPAEFRKSQRKRCRLALQYAANLAHNARIFQEWGKYERRRSRGSSDPVYRGSLELTITCAQCRICALLIRMRLHFWLFRMALPLTSTPTFAKLSRMGSMEMVSFYEKIKARVAELGRTYGEKYHERLLHSL